MTKTPGRLRIPQWAITTRLVTASDVTYDENDVFVSEVRTNLDGGVVYFTVRDEDGTIVMQKDSTNVAEIEHRNQAVAATEGQADIKFVEADTAPLSSDPSVKYWFDCWARTVDGREEPIVDRGRFYVHKSTTHISAGPAPSLPSYPATQTPQERSFLWTWSATGDTNTVTIPGVGMVDTTYVVQAIIEDIPSGGSASVITSPSSGRTTTTFTLLAAGALLAGTTISIITRDRA